MHDQKPDVLVPAPTAPSDALTTRDSGSLVARGLADLARREQTPSATECYARGCKCHQSGDYAEAVRWYRLATDQGLAEAQANLGVMYATGEGVPQDYAEAARWYRLAADQGNAYAQYNLGEMCRDGQGRSAGSG